MTDPLDKTRATIAAYESALAEVRAEQQQLTEVSLRIRNLQQRESWYTRVLIDLREIEAKAVEYQEKESNRGN